MTIEESLQKNGVHLATPIGKSMLPLLKSRRNNVVIKPITQKLKVNDVVLCKRDNGAYILHRIIKIKGDRYFLRGDNQFVLDKSIVKNNILGVMVGFYKKDKFISVNSFLYKLYVFFWRIIFPIRFPFMVIKYLFSRNK
ncbi:MAG: hypothetical protein E7342_04860 [Clostridiales bacterium]|nr:hypothetical protein [Clostridiales bacterium]